jgi:alpha-1,4-digalacturonate transport system permease protein
VIWPAVATPTGVFLLRQYMLTIPDDLLDAARMDHAGEWRIYWRSCCRCRRRRWRCWRSSRSCGAGTSSCWPLIVLNRSELHAAAGAQLLPGRPAHQWHYLLAMTVITLLPITLVFAVPAEIHHHGHRPAGVK